MTITDDELSSQWFHDLQCERLDYTNPLTEAEIFQLACFDKQIAQLTSQLHRKRMKLPFKTAQEYFSVAMNLYNIGVVAQSATLLICSFLL